MRDAEIAFKACKVILDDRDPQLSQADILVTAEHTIAALLLLLLEEPRKAAAMLNEGLCPGVEDRLSFYASKGR